jgi:hypothetical protein
MPERYTKAKSINSTEVLSMKLDRDYVWECDYGVRRPLIPILQDLLDEQDASSLQMVNLFVNNIPYTLEFFVVVSYDKPQEGHIKKMCADLTNLGLRYRPDITHNELFTELGNRRFNISTLSKSTDVEPIFNGDFFIFEEKEYLKLKDT